MRKICKSIEIQIGQCQYYNVRITLRSTFVNLQAGREEWTYFFISFSAFGHISLALLIVHSILQNPTMSLSLYDIGQFSFTSLKVVYQMESIRVQSVFKLVRLAALACVVIRIAFIKARGFGCSCFISYNIVSQICFCFCRKMNDYRENIRHICSTNHRIRREN